MPTSSPTSNPDFNTPDNILSNPNKENSMMMSDRFESIVLTFESDPNHPELDELLETFLQETDRHMRANHLSELRVISVTTRELVRLEALHWLLHDRGFKLVLSRHLMPDVQVVGVKRLQDDEVYQGLVLRPREQPDPCWWR